MKPKKLECNIDLVNNIMASSRHGALAQVFVVCALEEYAARVIAADEAGTLDTSTAFIHAPSWAACARECKEKMDKFYNRHQEADNAVA